MSKTNYFRNKRVMIIGGSEGIGLATATELTSLGAHVIIASRSEEKLKRALQSMQALRIAKDQDVAVLSLDVMNFEETQRQLESIMASHGVPHMLINSAGYAHPGYLEDLDVSVLRRMMDVNYFGTVHTVKSVLPAMRKAGHGHIVNISSMAGYLGLFGYTGYCASKYAVIGFSQALRHETKSYGIHVSVVCPPNTDTPGFETENRIKPKEVLALEETVKRATPKAVAQAMLQALPRKTFWIHPTTSASLIYQANRLMPERVMDHFLRRPRLKDNV